MNNNFNELKQYYFNRDDFIFAFRKVFTVLEIEDIEIKCEQCAFY